MAPLPGDCDNEIQVDKRNTLKGVKRINYKPQHDKYVLPNGRAVCRLAEGGLVNLRCRIAESAVDRSSDRARSYCALTR